MDQDTKKTLPVWESEKYYCLAGKASRDVNHPGMRVLARLAGGASNILDLGCGDGTRLGIVAKGKRGVGVDISNTAIKSAKSKKQSGKHKYIRSNLESLPFADGSFDLVYSAYVLEHLENPEKVIKEAIRVTEPGGSLVLIAPNFGAPNRSSPVYKGSRFTKLLTGFLSDILPPFAKSSKLDWNHVVPRKSPGEYFPDADTQVEPYVGTLICYLKSLGMEVVSFTSCWGEELPGAGLTQKIFGVLGRLGIYPFTLWGPHLVVVALKPKLK